MESACKPGPVEDSHSSGMYVTAHLKRPTRTRCGPHQWVPIWSCSERGLPSPQTVTSCAVRSYRTFSPLPVTGRSRPLRRYTFCCTFRRLAPPRCYLAPCPMEPGLSSPAHRTPKRTSNTGATAEPTPLIVQITCGPTKAQVHKKAKFWRATPQITAHIPTCERFLR
jgi:hypothetical protein